MGPSLAFFLLEYVGQKARLAPGSFKENEWDVLVNSAVIIATNSESNN